MNIVAARAALVVAGVLLAGVAGELALRVVYRDAGARTLGGPGGQPFDHWTIDGVLRGRLETGARQPGVPRVMVVGDSITYGLGVQDWRLTWPERLAQAFEASGQRHEFAVFAVPGNDMPQHLEVMREWVGPTQPDILIYQWYVNDIEAISHRPDFNHPWQRFSWHEWLRSTSYVYYVLDHRFAQLLTPPQHTYVNYLLSSFGPGSDEWAEFEREFHEFALLARRASRRILVLYPQVPFTDRYPLQAIHDHVRELAEAHMLTIPPMSWLRWSGGLVVVPGSHYGTAVSVSASERGRVVDTKDYLCLPGPLDLVLTVSATDRTRIGSVQLVEPSSGVVVADAPVEVNAAPDTLTDVRVRLSVPGTRPARLAIRLTSAGSGRWALADIKLPVDYGFEVVDLKDTLNTFNTHASSFDAHPNARAHQVIADVLFQRLTSEH